jgi:organic radical activating enzyme
VTQFRYIETMLFHTCNFNCAYCGFVTGGTVRYADDLAPYRDPDYIRAVLDFLERHEGGYKWVVQLSGGEPLLMPNLPMFASSLIRRGNKIRYNTNLSLPIEKDSEWLDANPPEGIDVLMVSLHPEGMQKYDMMLERIAALKAMGYPIITRTVAHPKAFDWIDRVAGDMAKLDVSYTPLPMFSKAYPQAYSPEQRATLETHIKAFSGLIQLNGGLDVSGRLCHAGSRLFALGLGHTGGGDLFRCVSTHQYAKLGNIFKDRHIRFLDGPKLCARPDRHCTCAFHFETDMVMGAEDSGTYTRMKAGHTEAAKPAFDDFARQNDLKFLYHRGPAPQGTEIGEELLIYDPAAVADILLGADHQAAFTWAGGAFDGIMPYKDNVEISLADTIHVDAPAEIGGGIQFDVKVQKGRKSCIAFDGKVRKGNGTLAVYSGQSAHFWHAVPKYKGARTVTEAFVPTEDVIRIYIYSDAPVSIDIESVRVLQAA